MVIKATMAKNLPIKVENSKLFEIKNATNIFTEIAKLYLIIKS